MKSTALIAVVLAALITTPAASVPADPVDGEPVVEASAPIAASASAVPIADAAGTADAEAQGVYEAVLTMYRNICGYLNWQDQGIITAPNMSYKGAMQDAPALKAAYELGKGL